MLFSLDGRGRVGVKNRRMSKPFYTQRHKLLRMIKIYHEEHEVIIFNLSSCIFVFFVVNKKI